MDQRAIPARADYLRFSTPVLDRDVVIAGPVKVELFGATDGPDTDFMAKLVDVYPDGYEALVLDAPIRARYRHGRMPDEVKMMTPARRKSSISTCGPRRSPSRRATASRCTSPRRTARASRSTPTPASRRRAQAEPPRGDQQRLRRRQPPSALVLP